jgi:hypothetical protein
MKPRVKKRRPKFDCYLANAKTCEKQKQKKNPPVREDFHVRKAAGTPSAGLN